MAIPFSNEFLVSNSSSPLLSACDYAEVGRHGPLGGVELDLSRGSHRLQRWSAASDETLSQIRTIWMPPAPDDRMSELGRRIVTLAKGNERVSLIVDTPRRASRDAMIDQLNVAIRLRNQFPSGPRIAVAIRPHLIENTRAHLSNLSALRLQASEWDLDLALDLGRELDWLWEAEAAMYRISGSLALVRLSYPTTTFDGRFRASLTQRTILSCKELVYRGKFSLMVPLPWWHWRNRRSLEAACRDAATGIARQISPSSTAIDIERQPDHTADRN
jgi:hypothetical protein